MAGSARSSIWGRTRSAWIVRLVIGIAVLLIVAEAYLQKDGYTPHRSADLWSFKSYDPYCGWVTVPGHRPSTESGTQGTVWETVWRDGSRASRPFQDKRASKRVLVVGCSYTYGLGVADSDTWVWKLNERFPDICFDNYGVYAYGACQSLRRAEQLLNSGRHYDMVIYAAMHDHPHRDLSVKHLLGNIGECGPYVLSVRASCSAAGKLRFWPCEPRWPGDDIMASINFAKRVYYAWQIRRPRGERFESPQKLNAIFFALTERMNALAQEHGSRFAVCCLEEQEWSRALGLGERKLPFPVIFLGNGREGAPDGPAFHVNNQEFGHPSALVHANWAKRCGDWLAENALSVP